MVLPVLLPLLAAFVRAKPACRKSGAQARTNDQQFCLGWRWKRERGLHRAVTGEYGSDKRRKGGCPLPVKPDLEFPDVEAILQSGLGFLLALEILVVLPLRDLFADITSHDVSPLFGEALNKAHACVRPSYTVPPVLRRILAGRAGVCNSIVVKRGSPRVKAFECCSAGILPAVSIATASFFARNIFISYRLCCSVQNGCDRYSNSQRMRCRKEPVSRPSRLHR